MIKVKPNVNFDSSDKKAQSGSALLLTLLVVSLMLVVVLSFVVFVRLELRNVIAHQQIQLARSNARLAAELAVAQLQVAAGPDTRVTLPAAADASTTTLPTSRMWTGVRDSAPYRVTLAGDLKANPNYNRHLGWLVSSPTGTAPQPNVPQFQAPFQPQSGNALLVGAGSVLAAEDAVAAPAVALPSGVGTPQGSYAFWVGDEVTKAQVNLSDPFRNDADVTTDPYRAMTVQRTGSEVFLDTFDPDNATHGILLGRTIFPEQLELLNLSTRDIRESFHDISLGSYGLPTNIKRGGLKRDLTPVLQETRDNSGVPSGPEYDALLAFQEDRIARLREETVALPASNPGFPEHVWNSLNAVSLRQDQADPSNRVLMFPPNSDMILGRDPGGPHWSQLLSWATMADRSGNSNTSFQASKTTSEEFGAVPVIARYNLAVYWTMDWPRLKLHFIPTVVL